MTDNTLPNIRRDHEGDRPSSTQPSGMNSKINHVLACVEDSLILRLGRLYSGCRNITLLVILVSSGYSLLQPTPLLNATRSATLTQAKPAESTSATPQVNLTDCSTEQLSTSVFMYKGQPLCLAAD